MKFKIVNDFDNVELGEYEKSKVLLMEGIAFHSGVNTNGAVIDKEDAKKDIITMVGSPLRVLWKDGPTTHGFNRSTGTFSEEVQNVGYIHNAYIEDGENEEDYKAIVQAIMWRTYYPEMAEKLVELHNNDELKFSIEAEREAEVLKNGVRKCTNNNFIGLSMVAEPSWKQTRSLMVAEDEGQDDGGNDNQTKATPSTPSKDNTDANDIVSLREQLMQEKFSVLELQKANDGLTKQLNEALSVVSQYKTQELGRERLEKLSKYCEPTESVEELGKLSGEEFLDKLSAVLDDYATKMEEEKNKEKPKDKDNSHVVTAMFDTGTGKTDAKEALLQFIRGKQ